MYKYLLPLLIITAPLHAQERQATGKEVLAQRIAHDSLTMANLVDEMNTLREKIAKLEAEIKKNDGKVPTNKE